MRAMTVRKAVGLFILTSALVVAVSMAPLHAQERWGEVGVSGILVREPVRYGDSGAGLVLNAGAWRKTVSFEAYLVSLGLYFPAPVALGGSVVITPFHAARLAPYLSAGAMFAFTGEAIAPNGGIGLKWSLNRGWGIRTDVRILRFDKETYVGISFGLYLVFSHRLGPRQDHR